MKYTIDWIEKKSSSWAIATLVEIVEGSKTTTDVSINKFNKDETVAFPKFDELQPGSNIEGNLWRSPSTGKWSLFPNRPAPKSDSEVMARNTPAKGFSGAAKAMETKAANIEKAQDNKTKGIMVASAFRDATLLLTNHPTYAELSLDEVRQNHKAFVDWYIKSWNEAEEKLDLPY